MEGPNAKIDVIATAELAQKILEHIAQNYFDHYDMIACIDEVGVGGSKPLSKLSAIHSNVSRCHTMLLDKGADAIVSNAEGRNSILLFSRQRGIILELGV